MVAFSPPARFDLAGDTVYDCSQLTNYCCELTCPDIIQGSPDEYLITITDVPFVPCTAHPISGVYQGCGGVGQYINKATILNRETFHFPTGNVCIWTDVDEFNTGTTVATDTAAGPCSPPPPWIASFPESLQALVEADGSGRWRWLVTLGSITLPVARWRSASFDLPWDGADDVPLIYDSAFPYNPNVLCVAQAALATITMEPQ